MRLQRCLNDQPEGGFFHELCDSSGDDEIDISFLGTSDDFSDLQEAALKYMQDNSDITINMQQCDHSNLNSVASKYKQFQSIIQMVQQSQYKSVLPDQMWDIFEQFLRSASHEAELVSLERWLEKKEDIFSTSSWRMFCFEFYYEDLKKKNVQKMFNELAKEFEKIPDRYFERERFVFICIYKNDTYPQINVLKKILMEYGIQDIEFALISEVDYEKLDEPDSTDVSVSLKELQQHVIMFKKRYANQYRLRKTIDVIQQIITEERLKPGPKLKRKVEFIMREGGKFRSHITDKDVDNAYIWLVEFLSEIDNLLELQN